MIGSLRAFTLVLIPLFNVELPAARTDMVTEVLSRLLVLLVNSTGRFTVRMEKYQRLRGPLVRPNRLENRLYLVNVTMPARLKLVSCSIVVLWMTAIGVTSEASADCLSRCLSGCGASVNDSPFCREVKTRCYAQCPGMGSHDFGAIAYSPSTGASGWSNKYDTQEEAENGALEECRKEASDCEIEVWFDDNCGAIAAGDKEVSWGLGNTAREAQLGALEKCRQGGDDNCEVKASVCSRGRAD
jgi:Domain of unknown function (DUF4189)